MKKKGLSSVVSSVLIILLVVVAVAIIAVVVLNTADKTSTSIGSSSLCQDATIEPTRCNYNDTNIFGVFSVKLKNNANIDGLTFSITKNATQTINTYVSGSSLQTLSTYSFLLDSTNTASVPLKLSSVIKVKDSKGNSKICQSVNTITCFPPLTVAGEVPGQTPITSNNTTLSFFGNETNMTRIVRGCMTRGASNYDPAANIPDGSCIPSSPNEIVNYIPVDSCRDINVSGYYKLNRSITNIPGNCFTITANNAILDLNSYTIDGINNINSYAIYASGINNLTIKNGTIKEFGDQNCWGLNCNNGSGIFFSSSNNSFIGFINFSNSFNSIYFNGSLNNTISNVNSSLNKNGIYLSGNSNKNILHHLNLFDNGLGLILDTSKNNSISNVNSYFNVYGFYLYKDANNNSLSSITANNNYDYGINIYNSLNNTFSSITANNNSNGIYMEGSSLNRFNSITAINNTVGISTSASSSNTFSNVNASKNNNYGLYLKSSSSYNNFSSIISSNNNIYGLYLDNGINNRFNGNVTYNSVGNLFCTGTVLNNDFSELNYLEGPHSQFGCIE